MKKFSIVIIAFIILFALAGCGQNGETDVEEGVGTEVETEADTWTEVEEWQEGSLAGSFIPDELRFSSLEEFLLSYLGAMSSRARGGALSELEESVDLLSLERFYLPMNIPEEYRLFRILVDEYNVSLWFLPEEHLGSDMAISNATASSRHFLLGVTRGLNLENPKAEIVEGYGITEEDLIDGKYYFNGWNMFIWGSEGEILILYTPLPPAVGLSDNGSGDDLVQFTEMYVLDLTDEEAILAFLGEGAE
ncbi:MAG: hypothetical protein FWC96_09440 [Oscillospiraceae bacterium]|nr:hypothetical protein [Oscillospiraceae bacterium]